MAQRISRAAVACVLFATPMGCSSNAGVSSNGEPALVARVAGALGSRFTEPLLAADLAYRDCRRNNEDRQQLLSVPLCGPSPLDPEHFAPVREVLRDASPRDPGYERAAAYWLLAFAEVEGHAPEAVQLLENLTREHPSDPVAWNDLAAAYVVRAQASSEPEWLVPAFTAAGRALGMTPEMPEALFNRALVTETLGIEEYAIDAWDAYLAVDARSGWAEEARGRRDAVVATAARRNRTAATDGLDFTDLSAPRDPRLDERLAVSADEARRAIMNSLIPGWAAGSGPEADRYLSAARDLAEAVWRTTRDPLPAAIIAAIDRSAERFANRSADTDALGRAHALLAEGIAAYEQGAQRAGAYADAASQLSSALGLFESAGSPARHWAAYYLVLCDYQRTDYTGAMGRIEDLAAALESGGYQALLAPVERLRGLIYHLQGRYGSASRSYRAALRATEVSGDVVLSAAINSNLAGVYRPLGLATVAWSHRLAALRGAAFVSASRLRYTIFDEAAKEARDRGAPYLAIAFQDEVVGSARRSGDPLELQGALRQRAELRALAGLDEEALADLTAAAELVAEIGDPVSRRVVAGNLAMARGEILSTADPVRALAELERALTIFDETNYPVHFPRVHVARADAFLAAADPQSAAAEFLLAAEGLRIQRDTVEDAELKLYFARRSRPVFDRGVAAYAEAGGDQRTALVISEMGRSGELMRREFEADDGRRSLDFESPDVWIEALRDMPTPPIVVDYRVLPDALLIWIVSSAGVELRQVSVTGAQLRDAAQRLRWAIDARDGEAFDTCVRQFHRWLIEPVADLLSVAEHLVLVPDGVLNAVPFSALRDEPGRFLIEHTTLTVSPSINAYFETSRRYASLGSSGTTNAVVIGNPLLDDELGLPGLAGAENEARTVAAMYGPTGPILGEAATRARFLQEIRGASVVHFAGHAVANGADTTSSFMALASSPTAPGVLFESDLRALRLERTRLVVLSACSAAAGRWLDVEGVSGLARALFYAGVPVVVASIWAVDDLATTNLLVEFHRRLAQGATPARALAEAKRALLGRAEGPQVSPLVWAAFDAYGGA